jgi:hypothetical protein
MAEDGGQTPSTFYPFLEKGKPVTRVYKTLFLVAIVIQCELLFAIAWLNLDEDIEAISSLVVIGATSAFMWLSIYHEDGPRKYDLQKGLEYWTSAPEREREIAEREIRAQLPMQTVIYGSLMQRAGVILGFGFVIVTGFVLTYAHNSVFTTWVQIFILLIILIIYSASCFLGLRLFNSKLSYATTGPSVRHIMKYEWGAENLEVETVNAVAAAYFTMLETNYHTNRNLAMMSTLVVGGLVPIITSVLMGVLF